MLAIFQKIIQMDIRATLTAVWKRFPLPTLIILALSALWFYAVNIDERIEWVHRTIVTFIVIFFLSTALALATEWSKWRYIPLFTYLFPIVFGIWFYLTTIDLYGANTELVTYIILTLSWFIASVFVAPFLIGFVTRREEKTTHFYNYFIQVAWVFLMALVVGGALMALGAIAIGSVSALFDVIRTWSELSKLYSNWAVIALFLVAPLYGLIQLPQASEYMVTRFEKNRFFSFLVRYVATPFIYIYFFILYAYTAKVLMHFSDWPKWLVSWMVIGFSAFGYLIYIFSRAYEEESALTRVFRRYFPLIVLPQVCMLFYAIYLRIAQYDITMNRYFIVVFGIWLTIISLYYVFSAKKQLSVILSSLVAIILIISIGPWSVYSYPLTRQEVRLMTNLETAKILQSGTIIPLTSAQDISKELSNDIASGISYVCDFGDCEYIKELFPQQYQKALSDSKKEWEQSIYEGKEPYREPSKYQIVNAVTEYIKVRRWFEYGSNMASLETYKYFTYTMGEGDKWSEPFPLSISGYTEALKITASWYDTNPWIRFPIVIYHADKNTIEYKRSLWESQSFVLPIPSEMSMGSWYLSEDPTKEIWLRSSKDMIFTVGDNRVEIRLIFTSLQVKNPTYTGEPNNWDTGGADGIALIRDKK
jgi:Domain of unknown function (DUF4153)